MPILANLTNRYRQGSAVVQFGVIVAYLLLTTLLVIRNPDSIIAFLLFLVNLAFVQTASNLDARARTGLALLEVLLVLPAIGSGNSFFMGVATQVAIYVALALGLNIVVGFAGLLDLGYVAFFATGAYSWAIFSTGQAAHFVPGIHGALSGNWFWFFLFVGLGIAALMGIALGIPVLRLHGDYLAIVTLGFGEIIRILANGLDPYTNGPRGLVGVKAPQIGSLVLGSPLAFYFIAVILVGVVILANQRLEHSRIGRAWAAIREDEIAARAMGIHLTRAKLLAFAVGASFAGLMGVLFAAKQTFIDPTSFTFMESIGVVAMIVLGGMGGIPGVILGATVVTLLNIQVLGGLSDWMHSLSITYGVHIPSALDPAQYHQLVFGLILVIMAIYRPSGLIPAKRRHIELTSADTVAVATKTTASASGEVH